MKNSLQQLSFDCYKNFLLTSKINKNVICAISGGQDSQLVIYIFLHIRKYTTFKIVYCHHFWQRTNFISFWEIWKTSFIFCIPFTIALTELPLPTEEFARIWRQELFCHIVNFYLSNNYILGHTGSDLLETNFSKLVRGTSPESLSNFTKMKIVTKNFQTLSFQNHSGLTRKKIPKIKKSKVKFQISKKQTKGNSHPKIKNFYLDSKQLNLTKTSILVDTQQIFFISTPNIVMKNIYKFPNFSQTSISIIRPLIFYHRQDISRIIKLNKLPLNFDLTNRNFKWTRNKLREKIFPLLRTEFDNIFDTSFFQFLSLNETQQKFLHTLKLNIRKNKNFQEIIKILPIYLQTNFIHLVLESYTLRQIKLLHIEKIQKYINN